MANTQVNTIRAKSRIDAYTLFQQHGSTGCLAQTNDELTTPLFYLLMVTLREREAGIAIST